MSDHAVKIWFRLGTEASHKTAWNMIPHGHGIKNGAVIIKNGSGERDLSLDIIVFHGDSFGLRKLVFVRQYPDKEK